MQAQISEAVLKVAVHFKVIETNNGRNMETVKQHLGSSNNIGDVTAYIPLFAKLSIAALLEGGKLYLL